jgi:hypothetical protein
MGDANRLVKSRMSFVLPSINTSFIPLVTEEVLDHGVLGTYGTRDEKRIESLDHGLFECYCVPGERPQPITITELGGKL